jgi:Predicted signal transduction protein with a C-terminal ATPase domain
MMLSYLLACIVPLMIASITIYNFSVKSLEDASLEFSSIFNSQIVTTIDDFIDEYDKITKSALVDDDVITRLNNEDNASISARVNNQLVIQKMLMRLETLKPEIKCITLLSTKNSMYQYSSTGDTVNANILKEQVWFKQLLESEDKLVITSIHNKSYYERENDGFVLTVGRVIYNSSGVFSGVLLIDLDPASLIELNENFLIARNNYNIKISITDGHGGVLYDSDAASGRKTWEQTMNSGYIAFEQKNSNDYLMMSNKTHKGYLTVNAEIPRSKLLFKIGNINNVTFFAILISIFVIVITSILLSYTITRPIKKLQKSMMLAENGQYLTIEQNNTKDEINGLIVSYNNMITKIKSLIEDVYIAQIKQKNAKFIALQSQINPHMLYNTLESIRMKALVKGEDDVAEMIKILSRMFRLALGKEKKQNLIRHEIEYAENYIKLQNIRFCDRFLLVVHLSDEIMNSGIIALVFQPIIENSIKHGFLGYDTMLNIVIEGNVNAQNDIVIRISDDGVGMKPEKVEEINRVLSDVEYEKLKLNMKTEQVEESIGLKNIAERIKLHYGDNYYLYIASGEGSGTVVELKIPQQ